MSAQPTSLAEFLGSLAGRAPSVLSVHGPSSLCCAAALAWVRAMARVSLSGAADVPAWISQRWWWGPSRWPVYWCEAVRADTLDCGALAELALEALREGGALALKVQLVQEWTPERLAHWRSHWEDAGADCSWIGAALAYHEAVGLLRGSDLAVWDPADGLWKGRGHPGHGTVVAIRAVAPCWLSPEHLPDTLQWNGQLLTPGCWCEMPGMGSAAQGRVVTHLST